MRELRTLQSSLLDVFARYGYGEVRTPTIEYDAVLARAGEAAAPPAHRFVDESGELLALRSDMTIPIARMVATRFAAVDGPFRLSYSGTAYRAVRPQRGQMREFMQAGLELIGAPAPEGTAEVIEILSAALDAAGLTRAVIGLGDADLFKQLLDELGVDGQARARVVDRLAAHDLVGLEAEVDELELGPRERKTLLRLPNIRGGAEVLDAAHELGGQAVERATGRLAATFEALRARGVADRIRLDLGLLRDLGYYTGAIVEVYDPALGHVLGGGGRYDEVMGRFGRPLPAAGFALFLERLHIAQAEEERLARMSRPLKLAVPRGALLAGTLDLLDRVGVDTAEARSDSRALTFDAGEVKLVTMRPSDVPTYVEAGAADIGITGKDVLLEQHDRVVYELLDLRYGECRMVLASRSGDDRMAEAQRRLGAMRIATKYPRVAERYFEDTGRRAEVIEVKGSVELAPLVDLADGIVDLVDSGRTLAENDLEVREEIVVCTARLVANRVAHKLRATEIDGLSERLRGAIAG